MQRSEVHEVVSGFDSFDVRIQDVTLITRPKTGNSSIDQVHNSQGAYLVSSFVTLKSSRKQDACSCQSSQGVNLAVTASPYALNLDI